MSMMSTPSPRGASHLPELTLLDHDSHAGGGGGSAAPPTAATRGLTTLSRLPVTNPVKVGVIGLGYVGLPLCIAVEKAGHRVLGLDIDPHKVEMLNRGESYLEQITQPEIEQMRAAGRFEATADPKRLAEADAVLICVPTPLDDDHDPDLQYIIATGYDIANGLRLRGKSQVIILESTTYPGTTREVLKPLLDEANVPYLLAFSPERVDPGRVDPPFEAIPKVVGGLDAASTEAAVNLYRTVFDTVVPVTSAEVAESAKIMENVYRAVNIALVNETKVVLAAMGIDVWEVIEAASTKPYGFQAFWPGPGLGGHCIPIDPFYLSWKARQHGQEAKFIELAGQMNHSMPRRVVDTALKAWREHYHKTHAGERVVGSAPPVAGGVPVSGPHPKVLLLGLAYKPDIDDTRESPSYELIRLLRKAGCEVHYSDPHIPETLEKRRYGNIGLESVDVTPETLQRYDFVVIATNHKKFDYAMIAKHARLIIDTRNAMRNFPGGNVVKA